MKHILFVMPKMQAGGAEKSLLMLLETLKSDPNNVIDLLLFKHEGLFLNQIPEGINIISASKELALLYNDATLLNDMDISFIEKMCWKLRRYMATGWSKIMTKHYNARNQYRWIHFYKSWIPKLEAKYDFACGYLDGEMMYYVVDKVDAVKKYVWNQNDYMKIGLNADLDDPYYQAVDKIICLSDECQAIFTKVFPNCENKIVQLPPIVSEQFLVNRANEYKATEMEAADYSMLSIGRMTSQKGFDMAIEAAEILKNRNVKFKWFFIGNGELFEELNQIVEMKNLQNCVCFLGEKSNPYPYLKDADLFVQPSRFEGKSVILSEAKAMNKIILATDYDTVFDQIEDGVTGVITQKDPEQIAKSIEQIRDNENLRIRIEENLRQQKSDASALINGYCQLFELGV